MILDRIDAELAFKTLSLSSLVDLDSPDAGLVYTTYQAAQDMSQRLRPYIQKSNTVGSKTELDEMVRLYTERYGEISK